MRLHLIGAVAAAVVITGVPPPQKIALVRVFPNPGQIGLFIAAADGSGERPLLESRDVDYDPAWSPDGATIVFTSERRGSADLFRIKPDGADLEQLTDDPAYDDQAAFSPDSRQLVFVSTRAGGTGHLWTMELSARKARRLTAGSGGDFRPSWSPDGKWIAFSSDRGGDLPFAHGRWERLQLADVYIIRPDGSGLKRVTAHGRFCGSPKWTSDSRHVVAYCMDAEQTLANRRPAPEPGSDTRLLSIDVSSGAASEIAAGAGVKINPSPLPEGVIGFVRKDSAETAGIYYSNGASGPRGNVRSASWSPDGRRVVFHKRLAAAQPAVRSTFSRNAKYELTLTSTIHPSFNAAGDRFVSNSPPAANRLGASVSVTTVDTQHADVIYQDASRNVLGPQWAPRGDRIIFGIGTFNAFFNGFHGVFLKPEDRAEGGAQIALVNADGGGFQQLTSGPANNAFPSFAPDGRRFVFRTFGPEGNGLRIMNVDSREVIALTHEYDNFPLWSPRGDLIVFSRLAGGAYEIFTVTPDGKSVRRLTFTRGNDAHMAWSPDGESIAFVSSRMGFKDEVAYTDAPQPYGELFVMRFDGTQVEQLTDNQWEEGTPAWQPVRRATTSSR